MSGPASCTVTQHSRFRIFQGDQLGTVRTPRDGWARNTIGVEPKRMMGSKLFTGTYPMGTPKAGDTTRLLVVPSTKV
jgi:hypothetical protein